MPFARQHIASRPGAASPERLSRRAAPPGLLSNQAALRRIQAKLQIGAVNTPQEHAADAAADRVMRMTPGTSPINIQRQCTDCEEGEKLNRKAAAPTTAGEAPASVHKTLSESGRPLSETNRAFFEPRFGRNLDHVRLHQGAEAADSAQSIGAIAYASGPHVVLGNTAPAPESQAGRHLLAHELAHVMQQDQSSVRRACGKEAIGKPAGCEAGDKNFVPGSTIHFLLNCNDPTPAGAKDFAAFVSALPPTGIIQIDGYASMDGPEAYNFNLAAARALAAKQMLLDAGIPATRIGRLIDHGATPGKTEDRRSAVLSIGAAPAGPAQAPKAETPPPKTPEKAPEKQADKPAETPAGTPKVEGKPQEDPPSVLEFQMPISLTGQLPVGGPGGVGTKPPPGQQSQALNQVTQPNIALGVNYTPAPIAVPRLAIGLFGQLGGNFPLGIGNTYTLPQTANKNPAYFTGGNAQIYLQPAFVLFKIKGVSVSGIVQPGIGWTFASPVPGEDGVTYTIQGGLQASGDISKTWQFQGSIVAGGALAKPYDPQPGQTPAWQPFIGATLSFQFHTPIVDKY